MSIALIIGVIIFIVIAVVIFKFIKSVAKAIFLVSSLLALILIIFAVVLVNDVRDFKENFSTQPNLLVFEKNTKIVAAITGVLGEQDQAPSAVSNEELSSINSNFQNNNLKAALGNNYKMFIVKESAFDPIDSVRLGEDSTLSKQQVMDLLESETSIDDYIDIIAEQGTTNTQKTAMKKSLMEQQNIKDDSEFKSFLFSMMISSVGEKQGPTFLVQNIKQNNIEVYKETIIFKLLGLLPESLINQIIVIGES